MIIRKHTKSKYRGVDTIPEEVVIMVEVKDNIPVVESSLRLR